MDTTIEQQLAMNEALVPTAQRLKIGRSNFRLLSDIKSKESTLQLVYDVLHRCPFFNALLMDTKKYIIDLESFRDILHICPRVPGQLFADPPFEEEIFAFIHFLGHSAAIRMLTDVNINKLYQPWRSFAALINKCLTEKSSGYDSLRLSQAQILWGLYHKWNIDYAYLMWEDFIYQVEHKNQTKSNEMYYPRFKKAIIYQFMSKDPSNPRRNKVNWRTKSSSDTSITPPTTAASLRPKASTKGKQTSKASKAKSISPLSEVAMTEAQQLKLVLKRRKQQTNISQPSGSDADKGTGSKPGVPDVPTDESEEELSWNSTDDEGDNNEGKDDDGDEEDEGDDGEEGNGDDDDIKDDDGEGGDNDDADQEDFRDDDKDDDEEGRDDEHESDEETREEESFNHIPQTPEDSEDKRDGEEDLVLNIGEEERHDEEEEKDELYRDVNINQGKGLQGTLEVEDTHVTLTPVKPDGQQENSSVSSQFVTSMLNPILDVGMESIFETTSRIDVQTPTSVAPLPITAPTMTSSTIATTIATSQAPILPTTILSDVIQHLPSFGSLFRFDDRLRNLYKALVDAYESDKIILDTYGETVTLKRRRNDDEDKDEEPSAGPDQGSKRRREGKEPESASAPSKTATKSAGRSTTGSKSRQVSTSKSAFTEEHVQTTSQMEEPSHPEFETGSCKILIELEYHLEEVYKATTDQLDWVNPEGQQYPYNLLQPLPFIPDNQGRRVIPFTHFINNDLEYLRGGASSRKYTTSVTKTKAADYRNIKWIEDLFYGFAVNRESALNVYSKRRIIAVTNLKIVEWHSYKHLNWITIILDTYRETVTLKRRRDDDEDKDEEPSAGPDRGSKRCREGKELESASTSSETATKSASRSTTGSKSRQSSASESAFAEEPMQTTSHMEEPSHPEFEIGSCKILIELEYHLEEVYKATTDQLDWVNPEGQQYPYNLLQPLPFIPDNQGRRVIPFTHFINNDLEYLRGGASSQKYTTSVTKSKAADYRHIKWIEDLFYGFGVNLESARDVYSKRRIIAVTKLKIVEWHSYKHLDWITVRRNNDKLYKFKEGDYKRLRIQDIEDMLLLLVQGKLTNLTVEERFAFNVSLRMFTRSIFIQQCVEDLQLGVESYQKWLNLTKLDTYRSDLKHKEAYTAYSNPRGFIYQNKDKRNRLMRIDELHKFSDGTLTDVLTALDDYLKGIQMRYLQQTIWRKSDKDRAAAMIQAIDKRLKTRIMRSLERFVGGRLYEGDFRMIQRTI
nr:hypothetical protein [Tanacetum cinerariifolium]